MKAVKESKMAKKKEINTESTDRNTKLKNIMQDLNKKFGKGTVKYGKDEPIKERISFGVEHLDKFTGGGLVRGNFAIAWGGESCGKSTLAYYTIADAQKKGLTCAYFDLEHTFNVTRAKKMGIDLDTLVLVEEVNTAEEAMDAMILLCKEKVIDVAIVDSIQAMSPKGEQETKTGGGKSVEDDTMALLARKMGQFLRMSKDYVYQANIAVLLIGQIRTGGIGGFAPRATLTGGNALKHFSMLTLFMRRGQKAEAPVEKYKETWIDEKTGKERYKTQERIIGFDCVLKIEKQKIDGCRPELSELHIPFYAESGFIKEEVSDDSARSEANTDEIQEPAEGQDS